MTRNEIKKYIKNKYKIDSIAFWEEWPDFLVFRNEKKKWFAIIMNVPYNKVYRKAIETKIIDVLNVKLDPEMVSAIKNEKGFAPAYHMNKTHWVSIEINKVSDKKIKDLIDMSFEIVLGKKKE